MRIEVSDSSTPRRPKRLFTLEEAERSLVLVRRVVADIVAEQARMADLQEILEFAEDLADDEQYEQVRTEMIRSAGRLRRFVGELEEIGVELKDWSLGVVDFPSLAGGREVRLCWQHGDAHVGHWHETDAGLAGLQPIATLPGRGRYLGRGAVAAEPARRGR